MQAQPNLGQGAHAKAVNVNSVVKTFNAGGDKAPYAVEEKANTSSGKAVPCNAASVTTLSPCKFWMSDGGCKWADKCKFIHTLLSPGDKRCFACSGVGHSKRDCDKTQNKAKTKNARVKVAKGNTSKTKEMVETVSFLQKTESPMP